MLRRIQPLLWVGGIAVAIWVLVPFGAPNYDTLYALLWGDELAHGTGPDYGTRPPTPHPLADAWGAILAPLGSVGASTATTVLAYLSLAAVAYLVYRLGSSWFDRPIGAVAALLVLTRVPFPSNGLRAFVDLPYVCLVLAALLIETRRPRAGWPVLALLALAGLLRPEAWLFSAAYLAYLVLERNPQRTGRMLRRRPSVGNPELARLAALTVAAPVGWGVFDLATTGRPLYSFTATRDTVNILGRHTGPVELVTYAPHELVQAMGLTGVVAALAGIVLALAFLRPRSAIALAAAILAGAAFALLASAGLAILARYMMLGSALLCVFCATALLGWRLLSREDAWRRRWQLIAGALVIVFIVGAPQQYRDLSQVVEVLEDEKTIGSDLRRLADSGAFHPGCRPISVPGVQAVPRLAAWLGLRPSAIDLATEEHQATRGYLLNPADGVAALHYGSVRVPPGFRLAARNESWLLYESCG